MQSLNVSPSINLNVRTGLILLPPQPQGRGAGSGLPQGARSHPPRRTSPLGAWRGVHDNLRHRHPLLPFRRPVLPDPVRCLGLLQRPDEHHKLLIGGADSRLPVERRVGDLSDEGSVEGERSTLLSRHEVRGVDVEEEHLNRALAGK